MCTKSLQCHIYLMVYLGHVYAALDVSKCNDKVYLYIYMYVNLDTNECVRVCLHACVYIHMYASGINLEYSRMRRTCKS